jgi:hypothetical protein
MLCVAAVAWVLLVVARLGDAEPVGDHYFLLEGTFGSLTSYAQRGDGTVG